MRYSVGSPPEWIVELKDNSQLSIVTQDSGTYTMKAQCAPALRALAVF